MALLRTSVARELRKLQLFSRGDSRTALTIQLLLMTLFAFGEHDLPRDKPHER
jgi:hypothetical protein